MYRTDNAATCKSKAVRKRPSVSRSRVPRAALLTTIIVIIMLVMANTPTAYAATSEYHATAVHFDWGSTASGSYTDTAADDTTYHQVEGHFWIAWYRFDFDYTMDVISGFTEDDITQIDTRLNAKATASNAFTIFWYDYTMSSWDTFGAGTVGTSDTNVDDTYNGADIEHYIDNATGAFKYGIYDSGAGVCQYIWVDYLRVVYTYTSANADPVNDEAPSCTNLDDTDNLYAEYKLYEFEVSVQDDDGYADIDYVDLYVYQSDTYAWCIRFDEDTNTFTEESGETRITLDTSGSTYSKSGINLDITFKLRITWAHPDVTDYDLKQIVYDTAAASDTDWYTDINYDYETRLDGTLTITDSTGTVDRGGWGTTITCSGTVYFYGSALYPHDGNFTNVHVHEFDEGAWKAADSSIINGAYSAAFAAKSSTGETTYEIHSNMGASGGSGNELYTDITDTYITDRLIFGIQGSPLGGDDYVNIDETIIFRVTVWYEHDIVAATTASATTTEGGFALYHYSGNMFYFDAVYSTVGQRFFTSVTGATETLHGISEFLSGGSTDGTWDRINVTINTPTYTHVGVGQNMTGVTYTAIYESSGNPFDGTVTLNISDWSQDTAISYYVGVTSVSGSAYGITVYQVGGSFTAYWENVTCTWSHFWSKDPQTSNWYAHITVANLAWTSGGNVPDGTTVKLYENGSIFATLTSASQAVLSVRFYGGSWVDSVVNWTVQIGSYVGGVYNITGMYFYEKHDEVPIVHTLYVDVFDLEFTSTHVIITYETNWHNASLTVWINGSSPSYFGSEGIKIILLPTTIAYHNFTILINGTSPLAQGTFDASYTDNDKWEWRDFGYEVPAYVLAEHITFQVFESDTGMWFVATSDLSTVYLKAWDNTSLVIPQTLITNILTFTKSTNYGWHNVTVQVGSATYGWLTYYCGYDVELRIVYLNYYDAETGLGTGINYDDVITLINGTQQYFVPFWVSGNTLNITVTDYYGQVIAQNTTYPYSKTIWIGLTWYELDVHNTGADKVRLIIFYGDNNRTITLEPYEHEFMRFVLGNYTMWHQFATYDINGEVSAWTTYKTVPDYQLGEYRQSYKVHHNDFDYGYAGGAGIVQSWIISALSFGFMVVSGVSAALGVYGYIQRQEIKHTTRRLEAGGSTKERKYKKDATTKGKEKRKYDE